MHLMHGIKGKMVGGSNQCFFFYCQRFSYYGPELDNLIKVEKVLIMFLDLFGSDRFEQKSMVG